MNPEAVAVLLYSLIGITREPRPESSPSGSLKRVVADDQGRDPFHPPRVLHCFFHKQGLPMKLSLPTHTFAPAALFASATMSALVGCSDDNASAHEPRQEGTLQYYRLQSVELPWLDEFGNTFATSTAKYDYSDEHELVRIEAQSVNPLPNNEFRRREEHTFQEVFVDESADAWIVELGVKLQ